MPNLNAVGHSTACYSNVSIWPYDFQHVLRVALGSGFIFTMSDLWQLILVLALWYIISRCDLDLWPIELESSWYIKCHVTEVYTKFQRNRAISGWIIDNFANFCTRYVTPWPWPLTSWPCELLQHFGCPVFKLPTKFEWNQIIPGWVIDDLARFPVQC